MYSERQDGIVGLRGKNGESNKKRANNIHIVLHFALSTFVLPLYALLLHSSIMKVIRTNRALSLEIIQRWKSCCFDFEAGGAVGSRKSDQDSGSGGGFSGWSVDLLPSPTIDPVGCGRSSRLRDGSFVCDPDGLLTEEGAQK